MSFICVECGTKFISSLEEQLKLVNTNEFTSHCFGCDNYTLFKRVDTTKCPKCNTELIEKNIHILNLKDYCPKCKDTLVYVMGTENGKGKLCFFNVSIGGFNHG